MVRRDWLTATLPPPSSSLPTCPELPVDVRTEHPAGGAHCVFPFFFSFLNRPDIRCAVIKRLVRLVVEREREGGAGRCCFSNQSDRLPLLTHLPPSLHLPLLSHHISGLAGDTCSHFFTQGPSQSCGERSRGTVTWAPRASRCRASREGEREGGRKRKDGGKEGRGRARAQE